MRCSAWALFRQRHVLVYFCIRNFQTTFVREFKVVFPNSLWNLQKCIKHFNESWVQHHGKNPWRTWFQILFLKVEYAAWKKRIWFHQPVLKIRFVYSVNKVNSQPLPNTQHPCDLRLALMWEGLNIVLQKWHGANTHFTNDRFRK